MYPFLAILASISENWVHACNVELGNVQSVTKYSKSLKASDAILYMAKIYKSKTSDNKIRSTFLPLLLTTEEIKEEEEDKMETSSREN